MTIDIVMPVRNEAKCIARSIQAIHDEPAVGLIHVVDGQSTDGTLKKTHTFHKVCRHSIPPSRGRQCDHGGKVAQAEALLFLHADVQLPDGWAQAVTEALSDAQTAGGAFQILTKPDPSIQSWANRWVFIGNLRSRYTTRPYGDQCIFVRKNVFDKVGGFPHQPLFEDYEFSCRMATQGKIHIIKDKKAIVSGRRMQHRPIRTLIYNNTFPLLYRLGISPQTLRKWYG
jgi:glycosyltransferase involved in cell wall biosynthesis